MCVGGGGGGLYPQEKQKDVKNTNVSIHLNVNAKTLGEAALT